LKKGHIFVWKIFFVQKIIYGKSFNFLKSGKKISSKNQIFFPKSL